MSFRNVAKLMFTTTNDAPKPLCIITPVGKMQQEPESQQSTPPRLLPLATITKLNRPESLKYSTASSQISDFSWTISEVREGEDDGEGIHSKDSWFASAGELKESHIGKKSERIIPRIHSLTIE